ECCLLSSPATPPPTENVRGGLARSRKRGPSPVRREALEGMLFASPWLVGFFGLTLGPMIASLFLSGSRWDGITSFSRVEWVGTENYRQLLADDPLFWKSLANTAFYAFLSVPLTTLAALGLALLLNRPLRGITIFRTVFYLPSILSGVATAFVWM